MAYKYIIAHAKSPKGLTKQNDTEAWKKYMSQTQKLENPSWANLPIEHHTVINPDRSTTTLVPDGLEVVSAVEFVAANIDDVIPFAKTSPILGEGGYAVIYEPPK